MSRAGHTFVVTGGASGLGEALVRRLHAEGGNVAVMDLDRQKELGEALIKNLGGGNRLLFVEVDVTDETSVEAGIKAVVAKWGSLQGAINCAGVATATTMLTKSGVHDLGIFDFVMKVNLYGSFNVARFAALQMSKQKEMKNYGRGVIVNVASVAAFDGQKGQVAYAASKGALVAMALPMARDLARLNIRVNTIAPGVFGTPMMMQMPKQVQDSLLKDVVAPKRLGDPDEFAACVGTILDNQYLNATVIRLDAGIRMSNL